MAATVGFSEEMAEMEATQRPVTLVMPTAVVSTLRVVTFTPVGDTPKAVMAGSVCQEARLAETVEMDPSVAMAGTGGTRKLAALETQMVARLSP